ncbi:YfaZ family outer membrane protein, partial [Escherichia coli]|uniref:YfaZ family outer membrane protein n=1 Tax=Escherichia coli TaxID=562 RepID=UPI00203C749A
GTVCVVGKIRDLILQLSKSSIYSTKPDEGYAAAVGGGLQWKIGNSFRLFGEYYYSPDSLSSGIQSYEEANAGARYTIMRPVSIEAGYRYLNLSGKDGNRDNAVADGPYVGGNASF